MNTNRRQAHLKIAQEYSTPFSNSENVIPNHPSSMKAREQLMDFWISLYNQYLQIGDTQLADMCLRHIDSLRSEEN